MNNAQKQVKYRYEGQKQGLDLENKAISQRTFTLNPIGKEEKTNRRISTSWRVQQTLKYFAFINYCEHAIENLQGMKLWGFCKILSRFIASKNPNQCRIYHKKMLKKFGSPSSMMRSIQSQIPDFKDLIVVYEKKLSLTFEHQGQSNFSEEIQNDLQKSQFEVKQQPFSGDYSNFQVNNQIQNSFDKQFSENESIKVKVEAMKTDDTVKVQDQGEIVRRKHIDSSIFETPMFHSSFIHNPVVNSMPFMPPIWPPCLNQNPTHHESILEKSKRKEKEWEQCNNLFLAWTSKLRSLMQSE